MAKKGSYTRHRQKRREYTDEEVREIREVYKNGDHTLASLGEKYDLTKTQVKYVLYSYHLVEGSPEKKKKIGFFNKRLQKWLSFPPDDE
tara:strand:+ start:99 stop:365 length:267 start_codon:yes stop_codon:yes gene_type:complete